MTNTFSFSRLAAIVYKEFIQMHRDRITFAMMIMVPILQLILFGYAINSNPKHLPTAIINGDITPITRSIVAAIQNTDYFDLINSNISEAEADLQIAQGNINYVINIPTNFTRDVLRGDKPNILVTIDATDPIATANALGSLFAIGQQQIDLDVLKNNDYLRNSTRPYNLILHPKYNPEGVTQYNIVPGLIGVILTMTMVIFTSIAITRERERGTMESLLSTPVLPLEVMVGKVLPYILVGYIQLLLVVIAAYTMFEVPFEGNLLLLIICTLPFISANLTIGLTMSTLAQNQLQAVQLTFFFFLPTVLLSGFMFPIGGMPIACQWISEFFPLTHYLKIVRGIVLKGNSFSTIYIPVLKLIFFTFVMVIVGMKRFRKTLD